MKIEAKRMDENKPMEKLDFKKYVDFSIGHLASVSARSISLTVRCAGINKQNQLLTVDVTQQRGRNASTELPFSTVI